MISKKLLNSFYDSDGPHQAAVFFSGEHQNGPNAIKASFNCVLGEIKVRFAVENRPDADFTGPVSQIDITARYRILSTPKQQSGGSSALSGCRLGPEGSVTGGCFRIFCVLGAQRSKREFLSFLLRIWLKEIKRH